jgi:hypothetical protein
MVARRPGHACGLGARYDVLGGVLLVFGTDYPARVAFYVIPTTALCWALSRFHSVGWPTIILAGAVYGFVTEGVLTTIVYGAFPFPCAISYTALAWHASLTVGFGLFLRMTRTDSGRDDGRGVRIG